MIWAWADTKKENVEYSAGPDVMTMAATAEPVTASPSPTKILLGGTALIVVMLFLTKGK